MTLTILVVNKSRVTANFALVQPSVQADVLKVVKEIVKLTGDKMPKLSELFTDRLSPQLVGLLRAFLQKDNKPADVEKTVKNIEAYFKKHPRSRVQIGNIARRIIAAGKLQNYGIKPAREYLKKWAKEFKAKKQEQETGVIRLRNTSAV